ncbi:MAG: rod shape-determining protein MreD [Pelodictyon phaeoclathratiforme]
MTRNIPFYLFALCIVSLMQEFGFSHLTLFKVSFDAVTIFLAFIAITTTQKTSMSFGFAAGVLAGLLTGNMGLQMLARTVGSFVASFFQTPKESHATIKQKSRRFYGAVIAAGLCTNAILAIGENPLGLSLAYRLVVFGLLESLFNIILALILNRLFLRKSLVN